MICTLGGVLGQGTCDRACEVEVANTTCPISDSNVVLMLLRLSGMINNTECGQ